MRWSKQGGDSSESEAGLPAAVQSALESAFDHQTIRAIELYGETMANLHKTSSTLGCARLENHADSRDHTEPD